MIEAFLTSTLVVALAEVGDKTQLLALVLALRYRQPWPVIAGIAIATLANHAGAAWIGDAAIRFVDPATARYIVAASFLAIGLWALVPDNLDESEAAKGGKHGVFLSTLIGFFLVEMGDKTQIATVVLAARYDAVAVVVAGTTLGMLLANVPVVLLGQKVVRFLPVQAIRYAAALLFIALAILAALGFGEASIGAPSP